MAESRDRRVRAEDIADVYIRRRRSLILSPSSGELEIFADQPDEEVGTPRTVPPRNVGSGSGSSRVMRRTPRNSRRRSFRGLENVFPGSSRGRVSGSILPSWYPRRPLQDITDIVRAIERRRARMGQGEGQSSHSPAPGPTALFEHDISMITPTASSSRKPSSITSRRVPKILLDITNESKEGSEFLTPEKKLLNKIDTVEKVVMEELNKQKRTPAARKAERQKRVRTLMSMR